MKIDKSKGKWYSDSKFIDDVAYSTYLNYLAEYNKSIYEKYNFKEEYMPQEIIMKHKNDLESLKDFYIEANHIIRKEKLEKLNENRQIKR